MTKHCKTNAGKIKTVICPVCKETFERLSTSGKRYCSDECREKGVKDAHASNEVWQARLYEIRQAQNNLSPEVVNEGYKYIRAAVVQQAVEDYAKALKKSHYDAVNALEKWFLSEWGQAYSEGNGDRIIARVRKECGKERV